MKSFFNWLTRSCESSKAVAMLNASSPFEVWLKKRYGITPDQALLLGLPFLETVSKQFVDEESRK
jgi:hypothetical protein